MLVVLTETYFNKVNTRNVFTTRQSRDLERFAMTTEALNPIQTSLTVYLADDAT